MQCIDTNYQKLIGRCFKLSDRYSTSLRPVALTVKLTRQHRLDTVKLKIWNRQKWQRENHNELQDN